jgi:hypothetical protein
MLGQVLKEDSLFQSVVGVGVNLFGIEARKPEY